MSKASQFLKLTDRSGNQVNGESYDETHYKEIAIRGWSWGVEDPMAPKMEFVDSKAPASVPQHAKFRGEREVHTAAKPAHLVFSKATDRSTTRLMNALDTGEVFPEAILTIEEQFKDAPLPFKLYLEFTDAFVVDFQWDLSAGGSGVSMSETWELNYRDVTFNYLWRGGNAAWIPQRFDMPADVAGEGLKKSPQTAAEKQSELEELFKEFQKKLGKK